MNKIFGAILGLFLVAACLFGQPTAGDNRDALASFPDTLGFALPGTCQPSQTYYELPGGTSYRCGPDYAWHANSGGGIGYPTGTGIPQVTSGTSWGTTLAVSTFLQAANNLSDIVNAGTARTNLGLGTAATQNLAYFLQTANNLSDLANASTARSNLGLGTAATQNTGTSGAVVGLLNANLTFSGLLSFTGLSTGTQTSCLGLSSGNALVLSTGACGSGGGGNLTIYNGASNIGSEGILNFTPGSGVLFPCSVSGSQILCQPAADTTIVESIAHLLSNNDNGAVATVSGTAWTANLPSLASYSNNASYLIQFAGSNSVGSDTLTLGPGPVALYYLQGGTATQIPAGCLRQNQSYWVRYTASGGPSGAGFLVACDGNSGSGGYSVTASTYTVPSNGGIATNQNSTASQAVIVTLPTPAAPTGGWILQVCVQNGYNGTAADTGVLTVKTANTGTQTIITTDGIPSTTAGQLASGGAAGDMLCMHAISSTQWIVDGTRGTWN